MSPSKPYPSKWFLSVSINPNGEEYPVYSLINHVQSTTYAFDSRKHCLQKAVAEKKAMVRMMHGDYSDSVIGSWIGARHFIVALEKSEYEELVEKRGINENS